MSNSSFYKRFFNLTEEYYYYYQYEEYDNSDPNECVFADTLEAIPSPYGQLFLIILYTLTSLIALLGNLTVIVVELYGNESAQNLRKYLINLALSDIIIGVLCVPFTYTDFMLGQWIFPHWLCPTAQYVQLLSVFVISQTLTIIGIQRYLATLYPFSSIRRWMKSHTGVILSLIWLLGALYATIPLSNTYTHPFTLDNEPNITYYECSYDNQVSQFERRLFMTSNFVLTFLLPLAVLIYSYSAIIRKLSRDRARAERNQSLFGHSRRVLVKLNYDCQTRKSIERDSNDSVKIYFRSSRNFQFRVSINRYNQQSKTIKMMLIVVILYAICWSPIKLYQFLLDYGFISFCTSQQLDAILYLFFACHWMAMANSFVNPIVYSFMSKSFRNDFTKLMNKLRKNIQVNQL